MRLSNADISTLSICCAKYLSNIYLIRFIIENNTTVLNSSENNNDYESNDENFYFEEIKIDRIALRQQGSDTSTRDTL